MSDFRVNQELTVAGAGVCLPMEVKKGRFEAEIGAVDDSPGFGY
jgi:hypothetical protein